MKPKLIIFGSRKMNKCQEQDLLQMIQEEGINSEIWDNTMLKRKLHQVQPEDQSLVLVRNFFYSRIDDNNDPEESETISLCGALL